MQKRGEGSQVPSAIINIHFLDQIEYLKVLENAELQKATF